MHTVRHQHKISDSLRGRLLPGQVASGLFIFGTSTERCDPAARLEIETSAGTDQIIRSGAITETQILTLFQHAEWGSCIPHNVIVEALKLLIWEPFVEDSPLTIVARSLS